MVRRRNFHSNPKTGSFVCRRYNIIKHMQYAGSGTGTNWVSTIGSCVSMSMSLSPSVAIKSGDDDYDLKSEYILVKGSLRRLFLPSSDRPQTIWWLNYYEASWSLCRLKSRPLLYPWHVLVNQMISFPGRN